MYNNRKPIVIIGLVITFIIALFSILVYKYVLIKQDSKKPLAVLTENRFPGLQVTVNTQEFLLLATKTQFLNINKEVIDYDTSKEYSPNRLILSFEPLPTKNPGYFYVFKNGDKYLHGFKITELNGDFTINYYLNTDIYLASTQAETDKLLENMISYSLLYLGDVHKNKSKITTDQLNSLFSDFKNYQDKYNTINVKKI